MQFYNIRLKLEWDEAYQAFTVTSPDVPELITAAHTPAEIVTNVQEVIEGLLEIWAELGQEPPPALRPQPVQGVTQTQLLVAV